MKRTIFSTFLSAVMLTACNSAEWEGVGNQYFKRECWLEKGKFVSYVAILNHEQRKTFAFFSSKCDPSKYPFTQTDISAISFTPRGDGLELKSIKESGDLWSNQSHPKFPYSSAERIIKIKGRAMVRVNANKSMSISNLVIDEYENIHMAPQIFISQTLGWP